MKKESIRDYAVEAFRFYAKSALPPDREKIKSALLKSRKKGNLFSQSPIIDAELLDLYAVCDTINELSKKENGKEILLCLETVYFTSPDAEIHRGDIEKRVVYCSVNYHLATATVYRYLCTARRLFALKRGLRFGGGTGICNASHRMQTVKDVSYV